MPRRGTQIASLPLAGDGAKRARNTETIAARGRQVVNPTLEALDPLLSLEGTLGGPLRDLVHEIDCNLSEPGTGSACG